MGGEGPGPTHQQDQPRALVILQGPEGEVRRGGQLGRREGGPWLGAGNVRVRGGVPGGDVVEWTGTWLRLVPSYT